MTILTKKIRGTPMENPPPQKKKNKEIKRKTPTTKKKKNKQKICRVTSYNWK